LRRPRRVKPSRADRNIYEMPVTSRERPASAAGPRGRITPEWVMCVGCRELIYGKRWERNLRCCPECGHHGPFTALERLRSLLDPGSLEMLPFSVRPADPLCFTDSKPYPQRLAEASDLTGLPEAVLGATGEIEGEPVVIACMDF